MKTKPPRHPRWRSLNIIFLAGLIGLILSSQAHLTLIDHKLALIGTVGLMYGLLAAWVSGNAAALMDENGDDPRQDGQASAAKPKGVPATPTADGPSAAAYTPGSDR